MSRRLLLIRVIVVVTALQNSIEQLRAEKAALTRHIAELQQLLQLKP